MEIIFPGPPGDGAGFNVGHVDLIPGEMGQDPVQGPGLVFQADDQGNLVRICGQFLLPADDDEPGVVALVGIDAPGQDGKAIGSGRLSPGHSRLMDVLFPGHHFRRLGRIEIIELLHGRMCLEKGLALGKALGMGIDFCNILQLRSGQAQQAVFHFHDFLAHDAGPIPAHQVIDLRNAAGGGILDGQHPIPDSTVHDCRHHIFKKHEVPGFHRLTREVLLQGQVAVGPRHPHIAYKDGFLCHMPTPVPPYRTDPAGSRPLRPPPPGWPGAGCRDHDDR